MKKITFLPESIAIALLLLAGLLLLSPSAHADRIPVGATIGITVTGNCNTASSTLFSLQPPNNASSTLAFFKVTGTQGATTTDIVVATSSTPYTSGFTQATSTLAENIMGLAGVAANSKFESVAGVLMGSAKGYTSPKGNTYATNAMVEVGPTDSVIAFSTTTNVSGGGPNIAIPSCTYKAVWYQ